MKKFKERLIGTLLLFLFPFAPVLAAGYGLLRDTDGKWFVFVMGAVCLLICWGYNGPPFIDDGDDKHDGGIFYGNMR